MKNILTLGLAAGLVVMASEAYASASDICGGNYTYLKGPGVFMARPGQVRHLCPPVVRLLEPVCDRDPGDGCAATFEGQGEQLLIME